MARKLARLAYREQTTVRAAVHVAAVFAITLSVAMLVPALTTSITAIPTGRPLPSRRCSSVVSRWP